MNNAFEDYIKMMIEKFVIDFKRFGPGPIIESRCIEIKGLIIGQYQANEITKEELVYYLDLVDTLIDKKLEELYNSLHE